MFTCIYLRWYWNIKWTLPIRELQVQWDSISLLYSCSQGSHVSAPFGIHWADPLQLHSRSHSGYILLYKQHFKTGALFQEERQQYSIVLLKLLPYISMTCRILLERYSACCEIFIQMIVYFTALVLESLLFSVFLCKYHMYYNNSPNPQFSPLLCSKNQ